MRPRRRAVGSVLLEPAIQSAARDAEYSGGALLVALCAFQHLLYVTALQGPEGWQVFEERIRVVVCSAL